MPHLLHSPLALFSLVAALALPLSGCGSPANGLCSRLDECNALSGQSVDECTENTERALEALSSNARADCERSIDRCNELSACSNFLGCNLECNFSGTGRSRSSVGPGDVSTGD